MEVKLLDGSVVEASEIFFNENNYHFFHTPAGGTTRDITNELSQLDKIRMVKGFDVERDLKRVSSERGASKGKTYDERGTGEIFSDQMLNKPLEAPKEAVVSGVREVVDGIDKSVDAVLGSKGVQSIVIAGFIALGIVLYLRD